MHRKIYQPQNTAPLTVGLTGIFFPTAKSSQPDAYLAGMIADCTARQPRLHVRDIYNSDLSVTASSFTADPPESGKIFPRRAESVKKTSFSYYIEGEMEPMSLDTLEDLQTQPSKACQNAKILIIDEDHSGGRCSFLST